MRRLYLNEGLAVHSIWRPRTQCSPAASGTRTSRSRRCSVDRCGGSRSSAMRAARRLGRSGVFYPQARIDGVELDPAVTAVGPPLLRARRQPAADTYHGATRGRSCARTNKRYDLIIVDAYRPPYVPFYLATQEFFRLARARLAPGGRSSLNVAADARRPQPRRGRLRHARDGVPARRSPGRRCTSTSS